MSDEQRERLRILIVDDEPLNRELLSRVLSREYEVEEAQDAQVALRAMSDHGEDIRVILCDQLMPGRMGTQLAEEIHQKWPDTLFLLLTGYDLDPVVSTALAKGYVHEVVAKPWKGKVLKDLIRRKLG